MTKSFKLVNILKTQDFLKMKKISNLTPAAIKAALSGDWKQAVEINTQILKEFTQDIEAILRLAKAYEELGKKTLAKRNYNKAINIDRFNPIAKRALIRLKESKGKKGKEAKLEKILDYDLFLEEPGKNKTISLIRLGDPKVLLSLNIAEAVKFSVSSRQISVRDKQNRYLGRLTDDLSKRLIKLIKRGNKYKAVVKEVDEKKLLIFIKEVLRSQKNKDIPSFPTVGDQYHTFLIQDIITEEK